MTAASAPAVATDLVASEPAGAFLLSALPVLYPELAADTRAAGSADPQGEAALTFCLAVDAVRLAVSAQLAAEPGARPAQVTAELVGAIIENMFDVSPEVAI